MHPTLTVTTNGGSPMGRFSASPTSSDALDPSLDDTASLSYAGSEARDTFKVEGDDSFKEMSKKRNWRRSGSSVTDDSVTEIKKGLRKTTGAGALSDSAGSFHTMLTAGETVGSAVDSPYTRDDSSVVGSVVSRESASVDPRRVPLSPKEQAAFQKDGDFEAAFASITFEQSPGKVVNSVGLSRDNSTRSELTTDSSFNSASDRQASRRQLMGKRSSLRKVGDDKDVIQEGEFEEATPMRRNKSLAEVSLKHVSPGQREMLTEVKPKVPLEDNAPRNETSSSVKREASPVPEKKSKSKKEKKSKKSKSKKEKDGKGKGDEMDTSRRSHESKSKRPKTPVKRHESGEDDGTSLLSVDAAAKTATSGNLSRPGIVKQMSMSAISASTDHVTALNDTPRSLRKKYTKEMSMGAITEGKRSKSSRRRRPSLHTLFEWSNDAVTDEEGTVPTSLRKPSKETTKKPTKQLRPEDAPKGLNKHVRSRDRVRRFSNEDPREQRGRARSRGRTRGRSLDAPRTPGLDRTFSMPDLQQEMTMTPKWPKKRMGNSNFHQIFFNKDHQLVAAKADHPQTPMQRASSNDEAPTVTPQQMLHIMEPCTMREVLTFQGFNNEFGSNASNLVNYAEVLDNQSMFTSSTGTSSGAYIKRFT